MEVISGKVFTGERSLFKASNLVIKDTVFGEGESPLKESSNIVLEGCSFDWKYPLWYSNRIKLTKSTVMNMGRAGFWYTNELDIEDTLFEAPKSLRRCDAVSLKKCSFYNALETLWNCSRVSLDDVRVKGDYFAMNSRDIEANNFELLGNYGFDGCENVTISNAKLLTKDAFWNCKNVTITNSYIKGEYFGWNSENVTIKDSTIESLQGFCYMKNLKMVNCKLINTTLAFEYSSVDAKILTHIDSVKNPLMGRIECPSIGELIMEEDKVDTSKTKIIVG